MVLLRRPVARSTAAAVLATAGDEKRDLVADLVLDWIDALAPVIAARRPPRRWSRVRRAERDARIALEDALAAVPGLDGRPRRWRHAGGRHPGPDRGGIMAAGLARGHTRLGDPTDPVVWETLRLTPPTWITARITTGEVDLDGQRIPAGAVVLVSPLLLGRLDEVVPGRTPDLAEFDPDRWRDGAGAPGPGCRSVPGRTPVRGAPWAWHSSSAWPTWAKHTGNRVGRARPNRPEPGHRAATVPIHRRCKRERSRDRPHRPAGHVVGGPVSPEAAALAARILNGAMGLDDAITRSAEHFLASPRVEVVGPSLTRFVPGRRADGSSWAGAPGSASGRAPGRSARSSPRGAGPEAALSMPWLSQRARATPSPSWTATSSRRGRAGP